MITRFKPKSEFSRNVLTLMTGTTIAQAIPIAISPILTRIYTPEDFGVFALFVAVSSIFGSIANGRYELAIVLPRKDEDAINIFALGLIISTCMTIVLLVLVVIFNKQLARILGDEDIAFWLYLVPISVFFTGLWNVLNYFNNRRKNYKDMRNATIVKSIVTAIIQLSVGFAKQGAAGLISGQLISQFFANTKLAMNITKDKALTTKVSKVRIIALSKRYKDFPKFSLWASLANTLSHNLTNILISTLYSVGALGFYSLVQRVLGMPSSLVGSSIGQVFYQQATKEKQQTGKAIITFNSTVKKLLMIGVPSFGVLYFIIEDLFAFVFGKEWRVAGVYAQILVPLFFIRFVVSTVSLLNSIFEKNLNGLYIQLILLSTMMVLFLYASFNNIIIEDFLKIMTCILFIEFILLYAYLFNLSKGQQWKLK